MKGQDGAASAMKKTDARSISKWDRVWRQDVKFTGFADAKESQEAGLVIGAVGKDL